MPPYPRFAHHLDLVCGSVYSAQTHRLAGRGGEVFPFHVGDTWLEPADGCRMEDLGVDACPGMHRYAPPQGRADLIERIATRVSLRMGVPTRPDQILVTAGATGGLGAVVGAVVEPGDEVLVLAPHWPLIAGIVRCFHAVPVAVPLIGAAASAEEAVGLADRHATARSVALYVSSPNNPTGRVLPRPWIEALARWARGRDLWILADEVYEDYVFDGEPAYVRPMAPERTFSAHSFSKAFGMAGNRCGYVVGPEETIRHVGKVSLHAAYCAPAASQIAAARALDGPGDAWVARVKPLYSEMGRKAAERLGVPPPEGSTFLFLDVAAQLSEDGLDGFLERCADRGLLLAPGPSFGPYPTHARLCFTCAPPDVVERGVELLAGLLGR